jgi:hypothetical protein
MAQRALLVGINQYRMPDADLRGCVNDVTNIRDVLLKYFDFAVKDIRVLVDRRATQKAIMERLQWLVKDAKPGDRLLFHFSGHGSQIRDRDGDELKDRLDEILCPHDMDWDGAYIVDDDLKVLFKGIPKGTCLEIFLDCCHSGTGIREMNGMAQLPTEQTIKPRFLAPPVDIRMREEDDLPVHPIARSTNPQQHALFAGCKDNQTSADAFISGSYNGAFTYYLCKHLRGTQGDISRGDLLKNLRASLRHEGYSQVPQLECPTVAKKKKVLA